MHCNSIAWDLYNIKGRRQLLATMLAVKRLAGVTPELNLREHTSHTPLPSTNKATLSGFETQRKRNQKSKIGVSVASTKDLCPPIFFKRKR